MAAFCLNLLSNNRPLFYFGLANLAASILFLILAATSPVKVKNVSAWFKPFKFALSIFLYSWTMAWYCQYLSDFNLVLFNWTTIILLGFEIIYIALQAGRGMLSHFNVSTPFYSSMFALMGIAATLVAVYTAYIGALFFLQPPASLPGYYLWSIRLGILLFVIFSFEGAIMGGRLSHTIGGPDGEEGIPVLNWSTRYGDPRIAHFIGMHALQVLPLAAWYVLKNTAAVFFLAFAYAALSVFTLVQALRGRPLFSKKAFVNS